MDPYLPSYTSYPLHLPSLPNCSLHRIGMPRDGHCLFHAINYSCFKPYINGTTEDRKNIVVGLRRELADELPQYYSSLYDGNLVHMAAQYAGYECNIMQQRLLTNDWIGEGYLEYIGEQLNKDIYIIDANLQSLYPTDEYRFSIKGNRSSLILYYISNHFELIGIVNALGKITTYFKPEHSVIRLLYSQLFPT
jgi:hypothetical protein